MLFLRNLLALALLCLSVSAKKSVGKRTEALAKLGRPCAVDSTVNTLCGNGKAHCALVGTQMTCGGAGAKCTKSSKTCARGYICGADSTCQVKPTRTKALPVKADDVSYGPSASAHHHHPSMSASAHARRGPRISKDAPW